MLTTRHKKTTLHIQQKGLYNVTSSVKTKAWGTYKSANAVGLLLV